MASAAVGGAGVLPGGAVASRRVRAFFAPVDRAAGVPAVFDPAVLAGVTPETLPSPWVDLGPCVQFARSSGTKVEPVLASVPPTARDQVRTAAGATVDCVFERWGKLQLALSAGVQQMNVLPAQASAAASGSGGGPGVVAAALLPGAGAAASTASALNVGAASAASFPVGSIVAVDVDYTGQTGFVGSGASGGYVRSAAAVGSDVDYVRRVTLNVGVVAAVANGVLTLAAPLPAGVPTPAMKVSPVVGFTDREGDAFIQEWTGLFCVEGAQGDRIWFYYPRLQAMAGATEHAEVLAGPLGLVRLKGSFRALASKDGRDGSAVVCYRTYVPAMRRLV